MTASESVTEERGVRTLSARAKGVLAILGAGLFGLLTGSLSLWLVRERLHIQCSMPPAGTEGSGSWICSDGIGYLGVAVAFGAVWFLALLLGSLGAALIRHDRAARTVLVVLAAASATTILALTWFGSSGLVGDEHAPRSGIQYWHDAVGAAAIIIAVSLGLALVSLVVSGTPARWLCAAAALGLAAATILQPGLGINVLPAAGLLVAASLRTPSAATARDARERV